MKVEALRPPEPASAGRDLPRRVERHLHRSGLIGASASVTVGLSGGLDSLVLLHLLRFPLRRPAIELRAAHLDHAMRPDSAADAAWVRGVCRAWDVPLVAEQLADPPASEAAARAARYAFLERAAPSGHLILTAHHLDDQAETVLFRAIRGTGLRGLRAIAPRRGRIVRPLLPFARVELAAYARAVRLPWREDPTNLDTRLARNRLRHIVLPELERAHPGAARGLARLAAAATAAEAAWHALTSRLETEVLLEIHDDGIVLARDVLQAYHPVVRARVLRHLLRRYGSMPGRAGTHAALEFIKTGRSGGEIHLPGGVRVERDFDRIRVRNPARATGVDRPVRIPAIGAGSGRGRIGGRAVVVRWGRGIDPPPEATIAVPDDTVFPLVLRGWRPGDRIRLAYGTKKLKKLFGERKLDRRARQSTPLLVDARGRVLWAVGVARAEPASDTSEGFQIAVEDAGQH